MDQPESAQPKDERELLQRARRLAGRTLRELAARVGLDVPDDLRRAKGWVGNLLERNLGAVAGSRAVPDFEALGVELKTIPVDAGGRPMESTFVATLDLSGDERLAWETSSIRKKLVRVLWVPVEADRALAMGDRKVGTALLWSPSPEEEAQLRADFEEIAELIEQGFVDSITGHQGRWLQLRPKGANAQALRWSIGPEGERVRTPPRAFYLRPAFTEALIQRHYQRGR